MTNPLVSLMDVVADAVDWIHDTFSDPELSKEIRADLGLAEDADPQVQLPTGQQIRMRHPDGSAVDVDKAAFDATVEEVKNAVGLIIEFIRGTRQRRRRRVGRHCSCSARSAPPSRSAPAGRSPTTSPGPAD